MMNGDQLAAEAIKAIGGKVTPMRLKTFKAFCNAIVSHIQTNMVVVSNGTSPPGGGPVTTTSTVVQ